jgi:hypothetical protein
MSSIWIVRAGRNLRSALYLLMINYIIVWFSNKYLLPEDWNWPYPDLFTSVGIIIDIISIFIVYYLFKMADNLIRVNEDITNPPESRSLENESRSLENIGDKKVRCSICKVHAFVETGIFVYKCHNCSSTQEVRL